MMTEAAGGGADEQKLTGGINTKEHWEDPDEEENIKKEETKPNVETKANPAGVVTTTLDTTTSKEGETKKTTLTTASDNPEALGFIDSFEPSSKDDFENFAEILCTKIKKYENSAQYGPFLETFYRSVSLGLEAEDIKTLSSQLTALSNEKQKLKGKPGKKTAKKTKASLVVGKDIDAFADLEQNTGYGDEFEDYM